MQDKCLTNLRGTDTSIVNLWLALKRFNSAHKNVSSANDKRCSTRWVSSDDESNMRNVYHDSQDTDITRIRYDIQIITDEEKIILQTWNTYLLQGLFITTIHCVLIMNAHFQQ